MCNIYLKFKSKSINSKYSLTIYDEISPDNVADDVELVHPRKSSLERIALL